LLPPASAVARAGVVEMHPEIHHILIGRKAMESG
jgi:hypothetical protein